MAAPPQPCSPCLSYQASKPHRHHSGRCLLNTTSGVDAGVVEHSGSKEPVGAYRQGPPASSPARLKQPHRLSTPRGRHHQRYGPAARVVRLCAGIFLVLLLLVDRCNGLRKVPDGWGAGPPPGVYRHHGVVTRIKRASIVGTSGTNRLADRHETQAKMRMGYRRAPNGCLEAWLGFKQPSD